MFSFSNVDHDNIMSSRDPVHVDVTVTTHSNSMSLQDAMSAPKTMTAMLPITIGVAGWWNNHQSPVTITMFVKFLKTVS